MTECNGARQNTLPSPPGKCSVCGMPYPTNPYEEKLVLKSPASNGVCYECLFWGNVVENHQQYRREVMDGVAFVVLDESGIIPNSPTVGKTVYAMRDGLIPLKFTHTLTLGEVPKYWAEQLPDTCTSISAKTYKRLVNSSHKCRSIGCFDRYDCLRFDMELEKKKCPWNTVPKNHKIGSEACISFINKHKFKTE